MDFAGTTYDHERDSETGMKLLLSPGLTTFCPSSTAEADAEWRKAMGFFERPNYKPSVELVEDRILQPGPGLEIRESNLGGSQSRWWQ
jgi:hypothetical protein